MSAADLTKTALARYKEESTGSQNYNTSETSESKKRKLSLENEQSNEPKRSSSKMLSSFAFDKWIPI